MSPITFHQLVRGICMSIATCNVMLVSHARFVTIEALHYAENMVILAPRLNV